MAIVIGALALLALAAAGFMLLRPAASESGPSDAEIDALLTELLGGATTAFADNRNAFSFSARNLTNLERRTFEVGDSFF